MEKKFGALSSSTDPSQLSATVSGVILSFSAVIIMIGGHFGLDIGNAQVTDFAQNFGLAIGGLWFMYGVVRKVVVFVQQKFSGYRA